jgi:pimeloyl-ACP methyl ester carboxylesterase
MERLELGRSKALLRYLDLPGEEQPLVFLHGLGCASSSDFPRVAANPVLAGHRSLLVDLLGHGYSDAPFDFSYRLEDHAETVAELFDHLSLRGCAVVGHSFGGSIAITLAVTRPELVDRLVLAEANLDAGGGIVSTGIAAESEQEFAMSGHRRLLQQVEANGWLTRVATFRVCASHALHRSAASLVAGTVPSMRERLYELQIPRAFIFGERGLPDPDTERLPEHGIEVLTVADAGHDMPFDNPSGFAEAIARALG